MAQLARLMSLALKKLTPIANQSNTCVIMTNQTRMKLGVQWGNPETTPGGNAVPFYASMRARVNQSSEKVQSGGEDLGRKHTLEIKKNKVAPPFTKCDFNIIYGEGIDKAGELLDLGLSNEFIERGGSYYTFKDTGERINTKSAAIEHIKNNPDTASWLESAILEIYKIKRL